MVTMCAVIAATLGHCRPTGVFHHVPISLKYFDRVTRCRPRASSSPLSRVIRQSRPRTTRRRPLPPRPPGSYRRRPCSGRRPGCCRHAGGAGCARRAPSPTRRRWCCKCSRREPGGDYLGCGASVRIWGGVRARWDGSERPSRPNQRLPRKDYFSRNVVFMAVNRKERCKFIKGRELVKKKVRGRAKREQRLLLC